MHKKLEEIGTYHRYPNVLNREFVATKPNQKWVTDVTYIRTLQGWAYLSTIKDLYDGFIVAHVFEQSNSIALVTQTLKQAKQKEKVTDGLILHSDHIVPMSFGKGRNTLPSRIMLWWASITSRLPCRGGVTAGIMPLWKTSLDTSRKNIYGASSQPPLRRQTNSSMNTFTFTIMRGYN